MNFLSRLFGKSAPAAPEAVLHKDYRIYPEPIRDGGAFRVAARIEKEVAGEVKVHRLIRADTRSTMDEAVEASVGKAKQAIDQLGETLFA